MTKNFMKNTFIISKNKVNNDELFLNNSIGLSSAYLYYSDKTEIAVHQEKDIQIILIGYALDTTNGLNTAAEFLSELSRIYLTDYCSFLDRADRLNGRYVIIVDTQDETEIYNDATALRPIFVWNQSIFASHESLVRKAVTAIQTLFSKILELITVIWIIQIPTKYTNLILI